uniref:Si:ch211-214j24.10 n=1 Tax=Oryzias latipes TaxID=8090 RepID=A0A3P9IG38_ORYLA
MHIKTGTWESSNAVCEPSSLCDKAVLVSATNSEPHIRNRRLSPGSGNCGGGGGGCISGSDQSSPQLSPEADPLGPGQTNNLAVRKEKERKGHKGRSLRRESQRGPGRAGERALKANHKDRWVEDSLSLLKPPPAFPVQDSPAKLQPAVSYASKVKAGAAGGALEDDRPAIGVLLQNQWGPSPQSSAVPLPPTDVHPADPVLRVQPPDLTPAPVTTSSSLVTHTDTDEANGELLLSCRHLVEALSYHSRDPKRVVWYKSTREHPA